jgi:hypothetical protein
MARQPMHVAESSSGCLVNVQEVAVVTISTVLFVREEWGERVRPTF